MEKISRSEARSRALSRFYTGEPCKRAGHVGERFTSSGTCCECRKLPRKATVTPQPVEEAPPADERIPQHRDPGQWVDPRKIDAAIERIFNNGPRLALNDAA